MAAGFLHVRSPFHASRHLLTFRCLHHTTYKIIILGKMVDCGALPMANCAEFADEASIPRNSYVIALRLIAKKTASGAPYRAPRRPMPNVPPPENYVCDRCRGTGHYKANCPTLDNPAYDSGFATPAGIPTSMTQAASLEEGTIRLADGSIAALKTHEYVTDPYFDQPASNHRQYAETRAVPTSPLDGSPRSELEESDDDSSVIDDQETFDEPNFADTEYFVEDFDRESALMDRMYNPQEYLVLSCTSANP